MSARRRHRTAPAQLKNPGAPPAEILAIDWGSTPAKRQICRALLRRGRYVLAPPRPVEDVGTLSHAETIADGNGILGHLFGSKAMSREVANRASAQTGIGEEVLKAMLPVVAAMMMGTMAKRMSEPMVARAGVGMGGSAATSRSGASLISMLAPMLDTNRNGLIVDDVCGTAFASLLTEFVLFPTVSMHLEFHRPIQIGETVDC